MMLPALPDWTVLGRSETKLYLFPHQALKPYAIKLLTVPEGQKRHNFMVTTFLERIMFVQIARIFTVFMEPKPFLRSVIT
jgi:hypothetical protein